MTQKSCEEIAREIIKSATIYDSDEEKLHFVITERLILRVLLQERAKQEELERQLKDIAIENEQCHKFYDVDQEKITDLRGIIGKMRELLNKLKEDSVHPLCIGGGCAMDCNESDSYPSICQEEVIDEALALSEKAKVVE